MTISVRTLTVGTAALAAAITGLFWSGDLTFGHRSGLVTEAQAIIGRPLTPMSYAGVARRTMRRGYAYGAYGYAAPYPYRPACGYYPYPPCY